MRGDTVWAYANIPEFIRFSKLGYHITLLPHPGDGPGVVMTGHIPLNANTTWNYYPTYTAYVDLMNQFQTNFPTLCQVQTIATLASGRKILIAKISDNVVTNEAEPEFLYTSSIHGDETTGYILMLHLMDYLLSNYGTNTEVTDLVNNLEIYINPLANPDGTYYGGNSSVSGAQRGNFNGIDLNRNYPDPLNGDHPDGNAWQPETVAFMDFAAQHHFAAACNFHGGIEVVNYPWDTWYTLHADDNWWQYVSREYADTVHLHAPSTYMDDLTNGITNGAVWYIVHGGRQDYMNYWHHCREVTIEVSNVKLLPAAQLETHWNYNWRSLILLMKQARYGNHGIITDQVTGSPVAAKVFINGHDLDGSECYSSAAPGDYSRLIKGGTYTLEITAAGYATKTIPGVVATDHAITTLNIQLVPVAVPEVTTLAATTISANGATLNGTVNPNGFSTTFAFQWGTTTAYGNTTTSVSAGSGSTATPVSANLSGLVHGTLYHYRLNATNTNGTSNGSDLTFTTPCGVISAFPWNEGFENGGILPNCWTNEQVNSSGINWTFIAGNGAGNPSAAHGGVLNACLKDGTAADNKTRLITPQINLTLLLNPQLKFWHTQSVWSGDQDKLTVYYKTSATGSWVQLATYIASITAWTMETINLPNGTGDYYISFEGNAKWGYGVCLDDVSITGTPQKVLNLTVFLEGLFNGSTMNKAKNATGDQYSGTIADQITLELRNSTTPFAIAGGPYTLNVNTNGTATSTVSSSLSASYYIVVKHRNSLETWSASPVSFGGTTMSYDFSTLASQAFGSNMKQVSGKFVLFAADVTQDGLVDAGDMISVDNAAAIFLTGYLTNDVNGDGLVNATDMLLLQTNSDAFVAKVTP